MYLLYQYVKRLNSLCNQFKINKISVKLIYIYIYIFIFIFIGLDS